MYFTKLTLSKTSKPVAELPTGGKERLKKVRKAYLGSVASLRLPRCCIGGIESIVQIGAIIVLTVGMGKVTPTWAFSIFAGSQLADVPYEEFVSPRLKLLFFVGIPVLLLITYIPALTP